MYDKSEEHGLIFLGFTAFYDPPKRTAATAIAERLNVPPRIVAILEGESLVNDATALVAYRFAVVAVVTGSFSFAFCGFSPRLICRV